MLDGPGPPGACACPHSTRSQQLAPPGLQQRVHHLQIPIRQLTLLFPPPGGLAHKRDTRIRTLTHPADTRGDFSVVLGARDRKDVLRPPSESSSLSPSTYAARNRSRAGLCISAAQRHTRHARQRSRHTRRRPSAVGQGAACVVDGHGPVPGVDPGLKSLFWGEEPGMTGSTEQEAALGASAKSSTSIGPFSADGDPALSPTRRSPGGESIAAVESYHGQPRGLFCTERGANSFTR